MAEAAATSPVPSRSRKPGRYWTSHHFYS